MQPIPLDLIIETERLQLRAADVSDIDFVWSATRIDGFNDGLTWNAPTEKSELTEFAERNPKNWKDGQSFMFTSALGVNNERIGRIGLSKLSRESVWSFGFWVHPNYWGNGFAAEAGRAVLEFGFSQLSASKIVSAHAIWNTQSKRVIEKLGFRYTGHNPCGFTKNGEPVEEYEYELSQTAL